ncbi:MAG: dihydrofolate synthase, partial [Micrococcaceae bacterium]|nr:dihydrofolate synthase [Micrococcaceae bacterium]
DTVHEIALEKAGIIKAGGFLISSAQEPEAAQVLLEAARDTGVPFRFEGVEFGVESRQLAVGGQSLTIQGIAGRYEDLALPLHGAHQGQNAAVAVAAMEAFLGGGEKALEEDLVQLAFGNVSSPGRLELVRSAPTVLVDAGHNPAGLAVSAQAVKEAFDFSALVLVVGILAEKDAPAMLDELYLQYGELVQDICLTQSTSPRSIPAEELGELALKAGFSDAGIHVTDRLDDALEWAIGRSESSEELTGGVLITGSITVVGEARTLLGK